ncbi:N-acetylglucosaminyl transferase component-domain-containing protein [Gaertneriomyces semiglobifer]|nr:N-acetylglucosaminyl transferase component-domain-containing protein [Gaertneriomyces semiglobifer]
MEQHLKIYPLQQIDMRLQQACYWPVQYMHWLRSETRLSRLNQARYIGFYNALWLVVNDIIVGAAAGAFFTENAVPLTALLLSHVKVDAYEYLRGTVIWLMGAPAGLKLNSALNDFLGNLFLGLLFIWREWIIILEPWLPDIFRVIGVCGATAGASMAMSLFSDLLSLATVHLHICYVVASRLYYYHVRGIRSLFNLFRGKRRNELRNRTDSVDYGLDQLLLGTLVFTILVFLFPTVAVYHVLFSLIRIGIVLVLGILELALAIVNHFPLFALMIRVKDPLRLPAGVAFQFSSPPPAVAGSPVMHMSMKSTPLAFKSIFYQYSYLWERLRAGVMLSKMATSLLTGERIRTVPRLQVGLCNCIEGDWRCAY